MPRAEHRASSIAEYLSICVELVQVWSTPEAGEVSAWYRGQEDAAWELIPGEYRAPLLNPDEMRSEFMLRAATLLPITPKSDWEWYFVMQHYGLPTRLLDWTSGSLIGLHFALRGTPGSCDAAVWVLDPWSLNEWSTSRSDLVISSGDFEPDPIAEKYLAPVYKQENLPARPIAIVPPCNSPRITAQRGAFTVHGKRTDGLNSQYTGNIEKIVVPSDQALQMRRELRNVGINEFGLFPDLDGLCREIRAVHVEGC